MAVYIYRFGILFIALINQLVQPLYSQIVLHPYAGVGRGFTHSDWKNQYASNLNRMNDFNFGFELEKINHKKINFSIQYSSGSAMMNLSENNLRKFPFREIICLNHPRWYFGNYKNGAVIEAMSIPVDGYLFKLNYKLLKPFIYKKKAYKKDGNIEYLNKSVSFNLSLGVGINRISRQFNLGGYFSQDTISTQVTDTSNLNLPWDSFGATSKFTNFNHGNYAIKNRNSPCIQIGFKSKFIKKNQPQGLEVGFLANFGLLRMIESPFNFNFPVYDSTIGDIATKNLAGQFFTRGTYITYYLSYPITLVNEKGERYRDRHPKE